MYAVIYLKMSHHRYIKEITKKQMCTHHLLQVEVFDSRDSTHNLKGAFRRSKHDELTTYRQWKDDQVKKR